MSLSTKIRSILFSTFCLLLLFPCALVFAQGPAGGPPPSGGQSTGGQDGGGETVGGRDNPTFEPVTLNNPLANIDSLEELLVALLNIFTVLMIPVIVFFIIYAGFKYVVAQGNPSKIEEAHRTLLYAIIGGVLVLAAVAISEIIANTVNQFTTP